MSSQEHEPIIADDLLRTKFAPPHSGAALAPRPSLLSRLDESLGARLTLVSAPPGFGKTTLVSQWLDQLKIENEKLKKEASAPLSQFSILNFQFLTLDADDNDPVRFWRYVITACQQFDPEAGKEALELLRTASGADHTVALRIFLNDLARLAGPCVLVLDDYHAITSAPVHEGVAYWLEHLPAALHVIMLTRADPPLPLARLRARNQLRELRADDLRFTSDEAEAFLRQALRREASPDVAARLNAQLEGWPAGWRMLALLAQRQRHDLDDERFAADFGGSHQHVVEYFVAEVLAAQPQDTQAFLLSTAFLNRLNASLCDALTGHRHSAAQLEHLERSNLFVQRLSAERGEAWYRYHNLFAEAMRHVARQQLGETTLRELADRASAWHEAQGNLPEAIENALAAQTFERAAMLIERFIERRVYEEVYSQRRWLERLPQAVLFEHPTLCFTYANAVLFTENRRAPATRAHIEPYLAHAEQAWRAGGNDEQLGELLTFRAVVAYWAGDLAANADLAREALALLPESNALWRGVSLLHVVGQELRAGRVKGLLPLALESRALCAAAGNLPAALAALAALSEISAWRAELRQAALYAEQVLEEARRWQARLHYRSDEQTALTQLARIAFEQNDLMRADRLIEEAIELGVQTDEPDDFKRTVLLQLRVQHARGETNEARDAAQRALHEFIAAETSPMFIRESHLLQARLALLNGSVVAAQRALANLPSFGSRFRLDDEWEAILRAHVSVAQHQPNDALNLAREWREDARANERARAEIEWAVIEALAHAQRDDLSRARLALADALTLAQPEHVTRAFIEAGPPLAALLRESLPHWHGAEVEPFARRLLELMSNGALDDASPQPPVEPLSAQERRVLRLLAAGMTNAEIARELTVSVNTIKTQTQSIYRKLNVKGRDEAREAAGRLKLL